MGARARSLLLRKPQTPTYPWPLLHTTRPESFNPSKRAAIKMFYLIVLP
jgi:hypothetical protein